MNSKTVKAIYIKEIREFVRDKKNLLVMFAMPLLLYPLLIIAISAIVIGVMSGYESKTYTVAFDSAVETSVREELLKVPEGADYSFEMAETKGADAAEAALSEGTIDAYVYVESDGYGILLYAPRSDSTYACDYLSENLEAMRTDMTKKLLTEKGLNAESVLKPFMITTKNVASEESTAGSILGMILPLLLMIGVFTGVMNPCIDMTVGEKERGTLETFLSMPITGREMICGKFLAVASIGAVSALLYLITAGAIGAYMVLMIGTLGGEMPAFNASAFVPSLVVAVLSVVIFSLFLSAVIMCICTFTKTVKEASGYVSPIMMVVMLVSYAGYLDIRLTLPLSIVPVLNIVLLIKSVLQFEYDALPIAMVLLSNIAYAAIAVTVLGKLYTSDRILFGGQGASLLDRPDEREEGRVPAVGDMILVLAVTSVLFIYVGSLLQIKYLLPGVALSHLIIFGIPVLAAWYGKCDFKETFSLKKIKPLWIPLSILAGVAAFFAFNGIMQLLSNVIPGAAENYAQSMDQLMEGNSLWVKILVIALVPAVSEETLFRGYVLGSLRPKLKPWAVILITAVLFGVYHMNLFQGIYAALLGAVLAGAVYLTGSIFPASIIHFTANLLALIIPLIWK